MVAEDQAPSLGHHIRTSKLMCQLHGPSEHSVQCLIALPKGLNIWQVSTDEKSRREDVPTGFPCAPAFPPRTRWLCKGPPDNLCPSPTGRPPAL